MSNEMNKNQTTQNQYELTEKYVINPSDNNYANINPNIDSQQPTILPQGVILIPIQNNE